MPRNGSLHRSDAVQRQVAVPVPVDQELSLLAQRIDQRPLMAIEDFFRQEREIAEGPKQPNALGQRGLNVADSVVRLHGEYAATDFVDQHDEVALLSFCDTAQNEATT